MKIGIVSDSAVGFTAEDMKKYAEINIVPLIITENETIYRDNNTDISKEQIIKKLVDEHKHIKTSQSNREDIKTIWTNTLKNYDQILFLPIAKNASGQYESAQIINNEPEFKDKVTTYETGAAAIALKYMVIIAWTLAKKGYQIPQIIEELDLFRQNYNFYLTPSKLTYLARGGRIPASLIKVSNLLRLKAIIHCKEKISKAKVTATLTHALNEMINFITNFSKNATSETLYIINGYCDQNLIEKAQKIAKEKGFKNIKVEALCNILLAHTANNTIGFAIMPNEWIKEV